MNVDEKGESEDSGADPSGLNSSTGQVERDDRPQPLGDGEQQIKHGEDSSENAEDTSSSNDQPSIDTKQTDACPANESFDLKSGGCIRG